MRICNAFVEQALGRERQRVKPDQSVAHVLKIPLVECYARVLQVNSYCRVHEHTWLCYKKVYEESVVVRIKSNLLLMIFWLHIINYNS
jgi:hypothetical protein